jgi:hypothetical protein
MNNEEAISTIATELKENRATNELVFETLDGFNPVLNSSLAKANVEEANTFYGFMFDIVYAIKDTLINLKDDLIGNKLQEEENRREMVAALAKLGDGERRSTGPPPLPTEREERSPIRDGFFSALGGAIGALIPNSVKGAFAGAFAPIVSMFAGITKFAKNFLHFGKTLIRFAGPIAIAVSIITSVIGAIQGGIKGFEEDGVIGAIKGALTGAIDGLIGSLVKGIANMIGWVLDKLGMGESGKLFGPAIAAFFDNIYKVIGGFVDMIAGLFTLDSKRFVGGIKAIFTGLFDNFANIGNLVFTILKEAIPLIGKAIKGLFWDLPKFLGEQAVYLWNYIEEQAPTWIANLILFATDVMQGLIDELGPWLEGVRDQFLSLGDFFLGKVRDFFSGIGDFFGGVMESSGVSDRLTEFADFGQMLIDKVVGFVQGTIDAIASFFSDPLGSLSSMGESILAWRDDLYKKILQSILPKRTGDEAWSDPMHWVAKAIPDAVYDFAGMPKEAGQGLNDSTGGVNPYDKQAKAMAAGYSNWEDYKANDWKWKGPAMQGSPSGSGQILAESSASATNSPIIINQMGGNVTNMNTSNVNNNTSTFDPIIPGSALGLSNM